MDVVDIGGLDRQGGGWGGRALKSGLYIKKCTRVEIQVGIRAGNDRGPNCRRVTEKYLVDTALNIARPTAPVTLKGTGVTPTTPVPRADHHDDSILHRRAQGCRAPPRAPRRQRPNGSRANNPMCREQ